MKVKLTGCLTEVTADEGEPQPHCRTVHLATMAIAIIIDDKQYEAGIEVLPKATHLDI